MYEQFGKKMREARRRAGLTQAQLAKRIDLDYTYISKIERGTFNPPARPKVVAWLDALGITDPVERIDYLLEAGYLGRDDVKAAAASVDVKALLAEPEVATVIAGLFATQDAHRPPNYEVLDALRQQVGEEVFNDLVELRKVLARSNMNVEQAMSFLEFARQTVQVHTKIFAASPDDQDG